MTSTNHVPTLETSKSLKKAGFPQGTIFSWFHPKSISSRAPGWTVSNTDIPLPFKDDPLIDEYCASPIMTEILEQLPETLALNPPEPYESETVTLSMEIITGTWDIGYSYGGLGKSGLHANPAEAAALLYLSLKESKDL